MAWPPYDRSIALRVTLAAVAAVVLALPSAAVAKPKPVTGSLSKAGYTVIALAGNGSATRTTTKTFKLVPPANTFTLQLRDKKGNYAGPIVAPGAKRTVVVSGFRAGAKLGRITVKKGYAVTKKLPKSAIDAKRTAIAKAGRPIGAGRLGLVKAASKGAGGLGLDPDRDGIPGAFDIDDDGDLRLDAVDVSPARASAVTFGDLHHGMWLMNIGLEQSLLAARMGLIQGGGGYALNKNAQSQFQTEAGFEQLVALATRLRGALLFPLPQTPGAELDCTGLPYCTAFGKSTDMTQMKRFPADFDSDNDGFGSLTPVGSFNPANDGIGTVQFLDPTKVFGMKPGVDQTQIKPGQTMFEKVPGQPDQPVMVNFLFNTVPALDRWADEGGVTLGSNPLNYPIQDGDPGTQSNPAVVHRSPTDGDYWLKLKLWRPQRFDAVTFGTPQWVDMGYLTYAVVGRTIGANSRLWHCPASAYKPSPQDDDIPGATYVHDQYLTADGVFDSTSDGVWSAAHTLTFEVDLSACQRASGIPVWNDGDQTASEVSVAALTDFGDAVEGVGFAFRPQPPPAAQTGPYTGGWSFNGADPNQVYAHFTAKDFGTNRYGIKVPAGYQVVSGTPPNGAATCSITTTVNANDTYHCDDQVAQGESRAVVLTIDHAGDKSMDVELIAPGSAGAPPEAGDKGFPLPYDGG